MRLNYRFFFCRQPYFRVGGWVKTRYAFDFRIATAILRQLQDTHL